MRFSLCRRLSETVIFFAAVNFIAVRSGYVPSAAEATKVVTAQAGMSAVETSVDIQVDGCEDWPDVMARVIGNIMRFCLEFQSTPLATIDGIEIRKARDEYRAGKRMRA
jgi:hypothetical protein